MWIVFGDFCEVVVEVDESLMVVYFGREGFLGVVYVFFLYMIVC